MLEIRNAKLEDLDTIAQVEEASFPAEEAADKKTLEGRLKVYPNHFWLLERDGKIVSMVDGLVNNSDELLDSFYADPSFHDEDGKWQMLFGVETIPEFRKRGYASILMKEVIKDCIEDSRKGIILNTKAEYLPFYENLGFKQAGEALSVHGGKHWIRMILDLENRQ
ncbi:GNAT family N-acetyltransferase [Erysipelotrichaceae bacterium RD49]|nr:GNAT family N-acetyltransferase [Erysipelotrichaceae bacterium RD49]